MASNLHQALLLWGARKMSGDGFQLTGFEGSADQGGQWNQLPPPFALFGIRADACGVRVGDGVIGFAEAKSEEDIDTLHTREQLRVLGFARMRDRKTRCPLYIAVPRTAAYALDHVLIDLGLIGAQHVRRLHVPSTFLGKRS